jgi:hypothetical protein
MNQWVSKYYFKQVQAIVIRNTFVIQTIMRGYDIEKRDVFFPNLHILVDFKLLLIYAYD